MIDDALRAQFPGAAGYLNTATLGLPCPDTLAAMQLGLSDWQGGRADPLSYDEAINTSRRLFAELVAAPVESVAIGSQVSAMVGIAATAVPPGARVLCPEGEFTSLIFPFLARDDLELRVEFVPLEQLVSAIGPDTDVVAFSAVQSSDGRVADLSGVRAAATANGALTIVDATQAVGWLPLDATDFDFVVAGAYKWLLSPRGTAFMTVRPEVMDRVTALSAGWYAGESPWESIYGPPLRLAGDARRFDLSPGWLAWLGTAPALQLLVDIGVAAVHQHDVWLANSLREQLGMAPGDSAIVSLELPADFDPERLHGLRIVQRAGRLRAGFHLYNNELDVTRLVTALGGARGC